MRKSMQGMCMPPTIQLSLEHLQDLGIGKSAPVEDPSKRIQINRSGILDSSMVCTV